jgi:Tfp pilus assembly protein FimT
MRRVSTIALASLCALLGGCGLASSGNNAMQMEQNDIDQYDKLQAQLDQARSVAITTTAAGLLPSGNQLYWLDYDTDTPMLHRYDDTGGPAIDYLFSVGSADSENFRASGSMVVTATATDTVIYTAYDSTQANHVLDTTSLPLPSDGTNWYAYATDAGTVYIVVPTADESGNPITQVQSWKPGSPPVVLTTLEAAGVPYGEFIDFDVFGNTMVFIDSGALWQLDLTTLKATPLGNMNESGNSVEIDSDAVLYTTSEGLFLYRYSDGVTLMLSQLIASAGYKLNATFSMIQDWSTDFARYQDWVVYVGDSGVFAYNLTSKVIKPILLTPRTADPLQYRYPCVLDDGTLLIVAVTDSAGPTYKLSLPAILGN